MGDRAPDIVYWLCTGTLGPDSTVAYHTRTVVIGNPKLDSVTCLQWDWQERRHTTCSTTYSQRVFTGGSWEADNNRGSYRLILAAEDTWGYGAKAILQWLGRTADGTADSIHATLELPVEPAAAISPEPWFLLGDGQAVVRIASTKPKAWGGTRWYSFVLGEPAEAHRVSDR
jgi:hypothetical protein